MHHDTLLLFGNVCHTVKIVSYHPNVQSASDDAEPDNQPKVQPVSMLDHQLLAQVKEKSRKSRLD